MGFEQHIDLAKFPIGDLADAEAAALVGRCRSSLARCGAYVLEGFLRGRAVAAALAELAPSLEHAFYAPKTHNAYLAPADPRFASSHPRNRVLHTSSATLAYDHIGTGGLLERLYRWPPLRAFIAETLGYDELHPYADELAAINVLVYPPGTQTGWHFDNANFVVTLLLQEGEGGGAYEYVPFIRSPGEENYPAVEAVLDGDPGPVQTLEQHAGDLVVFQGRYTLHRVTPVQGGRQRLVAVLAYDTRPGTTLTEHTRTTFYGRARAGDAVPARDTGAG